MDVNQNNSNEPVLSISTDGVQWAQEKYEFPEGLKSSNSGGSGVSIEDLNLVYGNGRFVLTASARYGWSGRLLAYSSNGRQWTNLISKESVSSISHCCGKSISPFNFNLGNMSGLALGCLEEVDSTCPLQVPMQSKLAQQQSLPSVLTSHQPHQWLCPSRATT